MKFLNKISDNILLICTFFLLIFIPLYPKLPLLDIKNTWVYVRIEDLLIAVILSLWVVLVFKKKISFKTPLTMPIIIFWIIGGIATIHGVLLLFPTLENVFPNLALLNYLRKIEYVSLFFVAYSAVKDKKIIPYIIGTLTVTVFLVALYGFGQKYFGFHAYLTMNEEFAKGTPLRLSELSRISSTFAGHYDLAAYLVLILPILTSMVFGFKNLLARFFLIITILSGFFLLLMTVSRISVFVLLFSLGLVLIFHKKRLAILAILSIFLLSLTFLSFSTSLLERFGNTVKEVEVLTDAYSGEAIGPIKEVASEDFKDKQIKVKFAQTKVEVENALGYKNEEDKLATDPATLLNTSNLPKTISVVYEPNSPTGENLPQGTGYVNLTLAPITQKINLFIYQKSNNQGSQESNRLIAIQGNFLKKKVLAYDLSFTTRFQGEWPKTLSIFKKDILFGAGYSSTGLAVDNNYLRILGEVGLLGFLSYFGIIFLALLYMKKVLPNTDSKVTKSFVYGIYAGIFGLALNATLIDVFEASKIAYVFWLLIGITVGTLHLYDNKQIDLYSEFKKALSSTYAIVIYLFIVVFVSYIGILNYYFVGDDFIWLRWSADCNNVQGINNCSGIFARIIDYFTNSQGFFYRPGTKLYFQLMYSGFWLNQTIYHIVSILLHFMVAVLFFLFAKKIFKNLFLGAGAAFTFVALSGYSEVIFWISSTGFLFNALFILSSLLFFILWKEKKRKILLFLSTISVALSLLFHEMGVIAPLLIVLYDFIFSDKTQFKQGFKKLEYFAIFSPIPMYLALRLYSQSHWFSGDYSYNIIKLPFNVIGNTFGYLSLSLLGPISLPFYQELRNLLKENVLISLIISLIIVFVIIILNKKIFNNFDQEERKIYIFGLLFFFISLLPFLGLGNIASRYSYLSSMGLVLIFVFCLKKIYIYLKNITGKDISIASLTVLLSIFTLLQIIQFQKIQGDWLEAGEKARRFIVAINGIYDDTWSTKNMNLYFVNVPIRTGDAWIFPVGLKDAIWFVFGNKNINIYEYLSLNDALNQIVNPTTDKVFEFDNSGIITEKFPPDPTSSQ